MGSDTWEEVERLYCAGRQDEALPLFEEFLDSLPEKEITEQPDICGFITVIPLVY